MRSIISEDIGNVFFSSRRRHTRWPRDWSSDVCSSDLSDEVYGAPRIARELAIGGVAVDRKTVAASMRRQGLEGISPAMFTPVTTIQDPAARGFADHAQRRWDQGRLDAV